MKLRHNPRRQLAIAMAASFMGWLGLPLGPAHASEDPRSADQWGLGKIGAERAWQAATGEGILIAVIDSGVDLAHEDLASKLVPGVDYYDGGTPQDQNGHGTHVAGIAAAVTGNGKGVAGTAPGAKILPMRVLGPNGACSPCSTARAIDESVSRGADVINLSLASRGKAVLGPYKEFAEALDRAWAAGTIPVLAAGNDYILESGYENNPALVVSATDRNDRKPDFSSGVGAAMWALAAPGGGSTLDPRTADIFSTDWDGHTPNLYGYNAGTSMSAPFVSGAAAVLLSMGLTPQQTVDRLLSTAIDIGSPGRDSTFGSGRLDLAAAVEGISSGGAGSGGGGSTGSGGGSSGKTGGSRPGRDVTSPLPSPDAETPTPAPSPSPGSSPRVSAGSGGGNGPGPGASRPGWLVWAGVAAAGAASAGYLAYLRRRKAPV